MTIHVSPRGAWSPSLRGMGSKAAEDPWLEIQPLIVSRFISPYSSCTKDAAWHLPESKERQLAVRCRLPGTDAVQFVDHGSKSSSCNRYTYRCRDNPLHTRARLAWGLKGILRFAVSTGFQSCVCRFSMPRGRAVKVSDRATCICMKIDRAVDSATCCHY